MPAVPWCRDLVDEYRARFGEDLLAQRRSLFVGETDADRHVRRQFWSLIADLVAERYFGALGTWCQQHGIASSGHTLVEESLLLQLAVEGNGLQVLSRMQIPGLDALSSDPEAVIHSGWLTAGLPASAAALSGQRRVMTEVSDFVQKLGGVRAGQRRGDAGDRRLAGGLGCDRVHAVLCAGTIGLSMITGPTATLSVGSTRYSSPLSVCPQRLLYYPMYDLWSEYRPVAEPLAIQSQSARFQNIVASFMQLGQALQRNQISFVLIDHQQLAGAKIETDGAIVVGGQPYRSIVFPEGVELPPDVSDQLALVQQRSAQSVWQGDVSRRLLDAAAPATLLQPTYRIEPASPHITLGHFTREGHPLILLVNVGRQDYDGRLSVAAGREWHALDLHGSVQHCRWMPKAARFTWHRVRPGCCWDLRPSEIEAVTKLSGTRGMNKVSVDRGICQCSQGS